MVVPIGNGTIGVIIAALVTNVFGSYGLALIFVLLLVIALAAAFRIPFEFTAILVLPLGFAMAWWNSMVWPFVGVLLLYLGVMMYKYWLVKVS
jgi:hypothetical protein